MSSRKRGRRDSSAISASSGQDVADTSTASLPAPTSAIEPSTKKSKFDKQFKTDTISDEDVLSTFLSWRQDVIG
jgi:hypothetical protein